jgi:hypothetical protein
MLKTLSGKSHVIAWFFVAVFYLELVLTPVTLKANERPLPYKAPVTLNAVLESASGTGKPNNNEIAYEIPETIITGLNVKAKKSPAGSKGTYTTGPVQPETQSFQSVNSNNLVDLFTGDFSYNIPLLDVGGYPVNLHYQSGITMDQEASWVGLGWNINPGAITRNMRGLPDDFEGDLVSKEISIKPNKTLGVTVGANVELFGRSNTTFIPNKNKTTDTVKGRANVVGVSLGVFHNTYKGWGTEFGLNANINAGKAAKGPLSAGLSLTNNSQTGFDISPSVGVKLGKEDNKTKGNISIGTNYNSRVGLQSLQMTGQIRQSINDNKKAWNFGAGVSNNFNLSFARPSYTPTITIPYTSNMFSFTAKVGSEHWGLHPNFYVRGYGGLQEVENKMLTLPAYGYLNYEKTGTKQNVLLDFNREKDVAYSDNAPHIAVPIYTYDTWSISGEGTGGQFRAYRGDIGYVFDHAMKTKSNSDKLSLDLGFGAIFHAGTDINAVDAYTQTNPWVSDNNFTTVVPFKQKDTTYENVYFKNPGEKTAVNKQYYTAIGNDSVMRVELSPEGQNNPVVTAMQQVLLFKGGRAVASRAFGANTLRKARDKRTQVISYLNAKEASHVGLDPIIKNYDINSFPSTTCNNNFQVLPRMGDIRQAHHISEITVLNADGRRYVYGIPVYNKSQTEVTMSTRVGDPNKGLVRYDGTDNSINNSQPKDGYYNKETLPPFTHSFLMSGILSADYVDLTGNGITEDDMGEAVKFNYSRASFGNTNYYKWRAPFIKDSAAYNEGLKTDNRDERGSFTYGLREVWYLNSVESKTMIATFVLETDSIRQDSYGVTNENGGLDPSQKLYRLKEINLYAKADYLKYGSANAKPIKTVHFQYGYDLCKNNPGSLNGTGKLTLQKVWFSFNKNFKGKRNPYVFTYHATNPDFAAKSTDRWGNYKNPTGNPGSTGQELTNADYPYTLQAGVKNWNSDSAANNAAPWTLSQIKLPSGAKIKVTYESDDYGYVQNKRAMQFFKVAGFGSSASGAISANLYPWFTANDDYHYVFINVTEPVYSTAEITRKYLDGVSTLYFKLAVNVPADRWGKGSEIIPVYADIDSYGVRTGSGNKTIWIKVKPITGKESPFVTTALQFLRLNLPSKAYPFSEPGDNLDFKSLVGTLATLAGNIKSTFNTFNTEARKKNFCRGVDTSKSFVRLDNPVYKKLGGGLRVKKIEIFDNWNKMTGEQESVYGQTYDYTTETDINGTSTRISSGVATYEPVIGGDENPFKVPQKLYPIKAGALAPADFMYTEEPFAETFFPAPMIGYSKVRVQTIHKDKKSANGFEETEFYTAKDFPVFVEYTPLDGKSKKTYDPAINNFLSFNSKHYVTLSQGFKIELNDMHGKLKSQTTYAQNDLTKPISYTYNYYRVKNDNAAQPRLLNTVAVVDSASGSIDTAAELGKDIEIMVDVREEKSSTISKSLELNMDFVHPFPPINIFTGIPLPSQETNRYRAIAVMKVVNRYGLLDSIIHIEKGSKVTTRNLLYDSETGDVLLSQTNNEFDDPVYNFSYPAHWAYSGMGSAYKNIGTVLKDVNFRKGIMQAPTGERIATERYFESGDELLVWGSDERTSLLSDYCDPNYYVFSSQHRYFKIWAVDASRGKEGQKGIYFIDKDGVPVSADTNEIRIIRSGKRNMPGVSVGSITSLKSPIKYVNNVPRLVFDSTTNVIAASAGRFKDLWKVDSTIYAKDTTIITARKMTLKYDTVYAVDSYQIDNYFPVGSDDDRRLQDHPTWPHFEASSFNNGNQDQEIRSWLKFDIQGKIPQGALIQSASLHLYGCVNELHNNYRISNSCYLERLKAPWLRSVIVNSGGDHYKMLERYFGEGGDQITIETATRVVLPATTPHGESVFRNDTPNITSMFQAMVDQYYSTNAGVWPALRMRLVNVGSDVTGLQSRLIYNTAQTPEECPSTFEGPVNSCVPSIIVAYYEPCASGSQPTYSYWPDPGYYCYDLPKDTFLCKPNINDTAVNFYRFGVLGNWRMDRAYTYYGPRMESNPADTTNIRTDGAIKSFVPYWSFTDSSLTASTDTTRWVWNSELTAFNNKSYEIENHDPLNRYNAGQYGYNQTLPVAVAQNARVQEIAFDGFEDYGYRTDSCQKCILNRHVDFGSGTTLVDTISHSGLYSLRVAGNDSVSKTIALGLPQITVPELSMKEDSTPIIKTIVSGNGTGLGNYYLTINNGCHPYAPGVEPVYTGYNTNVNYNSSGGNYILGTCRTNQLFYGFHGFIQPRYTGVYKFWVTGREDIGISIWRNGVRKQITLNSPIEVIGHPPNTAYPTDTMLLQAGEVYKIEIGWDIFDSGYRILFEWESQGEQSQSREIVPVTQLYPVGSNSATVKANTIVYDTTWCVKFKNPTASNVMNKRFSPIQGRKVLVSAWVKQDQPCITGSYDNAQLELVFNNETGQNTFQLKPTGNIIEGWQRIEDTLTIPETATSVDINMYALSTAPVYFDDIRIQPFNANMKTFVYSPVNLRLMAELDENNYATFYEYDDDGTLIRLKKETERGVKTIKETRSALLKE